LFGSLRIELPFKHRIIPLYLGFCKVGHLAV
jgi:hypothetical protein